MFFSYTRSFILFFAASFCLPTLAIDSETEELDGNESPLFFEQSFYRGLKLFRNVTDILSLDKQQKNLPEKWQKAGGISQPRGHLKLAIGPSLTSTHTMNSQLQAPLPGFGGSFEIGLRIHRFDLSIGNLVSYSKIHRAQFEFRGSKINADGSLLSLSYGPWIRWYTGQEVTKKSELSIMGGPIIGQHSLDLDFPSVQGGSYTPGHKLTAEGSGLVVGAGLEQYPWDRGQQQYIHFIYKYLRTKRVTEVGGSSTEVELLHTEDHKGVINEHAFFIGFGGIVF